jgi:hypothetical protein
MNVTEQRIHDCVRSQIGDKVVNRILNKVVIQLLPGSNGNLHVRNPIFELTGGRVYGTVWRQAGDHINRQVLTRVMDGGIL